MIRLLTTRSSVLCVARALSGYPEESLDKPIPNLVQSSTEHQNAVSNKDFLSDSRITKLENGLRVASQEAFGQYSTVGVLVDAGSRYEVEYTSGISHFLQRLAFQSSSLFADREALLSEMERYGGVFDCQRFRDVMMYSMSVLSFSVPEAVRILADTLWRPALKQDEIAAESQSIAFELEEMKTGPNTEPFLVELLHQAAYKDNTLGLPNICPEENLGKITAPELREYLAAHYIPSRMVLTGVNVNHQQLVELAREHFVGARTSWEGVESRAIDESISQYNSYDVKFERRGPPVVGPNPLPELTHVGMALESSSYLNDDFFAYSVLNSYMGGGGSFSAGGPGKGMYTHIYQNVLSRHHWVYWAMAQNHAYSDSGVFCLLGSAHPSQVRKLIEVLCQQFLHMTEVPSEEAMVRAKEQLKSAMMMNLESKAIVFEDIGRQVLGQDKKFTPMELCERIDGVSVGDLQRAGKRLLQSNPSMCVIGDLEGVPSRREVETALFENGGSLTRKRNSLFSFS